MAITQEQATKELQRREAVKELERRGVNQAKKAEEFGEFLTPPDLSKRYERNLYPKTPEPEIGDFTQNLPESIGVMVGIPAGGALGATVGMPTIGMTLGGAIGGSGGKAIQQLYNRWVGNKHPSASTIAKEQLSAGAKGGIVGLSVAAPQYFFPTQGVGIAEIASAQGKWQAAKAATSLAAKRTGVVVGTVFPAEFTRNLIENPEMPLSETFSASAKSTAYQALAEFGTTALFSGWQIRKGAGVERKISKFVDDADDIAKTMKMAGAPELAKAQAMTERTLRNKSFNLVKELLVGGENLQKMQKSQIESLSRYADTLMDNLRSGMHPAKAVRQVKILSSIEKVFPTINSAGKTVDIRNIKQQTGVPQRKQAEVLTKNIDDITDSIRIDAGKRIKSDIPLDAAERSGFFTKRYDTIFDTADELGRKVDTTSVKKTMGITPKGARVSAEYDDLLQKLSPEDRARTIAEMGTGSADDFAAIAERGRIYGYTTQSAKKLVDSIPDTPSLREAHAARSVLGKAETASKDPSIRRIFQTAKKAMTQEINKTAGGAGQLEDLLNTDYAYNQTEIYKDLTEKLKNQFTAIDPTTGQTIIKGKEFAEYIRKSGDELVNYNKLSPQKLNELNKIATEAMRTQDKGVALQYASGHARQLYDLPDNLTPQQGMELKTKLFDSLENAKGTERAAIRRTMTQLDSKMRQIAKESGVLDEWNMTQKAINQDRLYNKIGETIKNHSYLNKETGRTLINGNSLWNYLDKNSDDIISIYGMPKTQLKSLKDIARALQKIENVAPAGTGVAIGTQMTAPMSKSPAKVATVIGAPMMLGRWVLDNPYVLESNKAAFILSKGLQQGGTTEKATEIIMKAFMEWKADSEKDIEQLTKD